jgi:hypothetical protein
MVAGHASVQVGTIPAAMFAIFYVFATTAAKELPADYSSAMNPAGSRGET